MSPKKLINWIRILTPATTIASFFLLGSLLMVLVGINLAYAQIPNNGDNDDLNQAAVPEYDFNNNVDKSMVVLLKFTALNKAEFVSTGVSYGPPHSNIGNPPLLRVQIYDYNGAIIQQFNYWHPLFALEFQEDGKEYLKILPNATGRFVFPFDPNAALMKVSYLHHEGANNTRAEEVISVDLTIPSFCEQFPDDPECRSSDLAIVDVSTDNGQQQLLPILVGNSADVTVQTTLTNNGPDRPIDATLSSMTITPPQGSDGAGVSVIPSAGATPNENGVTTILTSLNERQQHDQTYTIECWEPGEYNIIFESEVASLSGAVADANELNNKGQMNLEVDCGEIVGPPQISEPLGVSIEANVTEDGSPPTTIEFRAITEGGTQPHKFRWNFDDDGSNSNDNNVKGDQLMTHQFTKLGQYNVTVTVTDSANGFRGQTASDNIIVTISDKVPPRVIVPSHIIAEARGPDGADVTFRVSATDIVDGSVPVSCRSQSSGTFQLGTTTANFKLGTTTVNCHATDSSGNTGYGNFTVTVQDTTPPTLTVPPPITVEATGPEGAVANFTVSATDVVDGKATLGNNGALIQEDQDGRDIEISCNPLSGSTFELGTTTVNCYAEDSSGNRVNGSFSVTVQDSTPPTLTVPPPITVEATGPDGTVANFTVSATDIVDGKATLGNNGALIQEDQDGRDIEISCNPLSGSTFELGTTTVNC